MEAEIKTMFKHVVEHIFNNWTALQLAVEHDMGGPNTRQTIVEVIEWITEYCLTQTNLVIEDVTVTLEDLLDEEFETICEDNSPKEVAHLLVKFVQLLRDQNLDQFETEFKSLPTSRAGLSKKENDVPVLEQQSENICENPNTSNDVDMDTEWTIVQNRKRK